MVMRVIATTSLVFVIQRPLTSLCTYGGLEKSRLHKTPNPWNTTDEWNDLHFRYTNMVAWVKTDLYSYRQNAPAHGIQEFKETLFGLALQRSSFFLCKYTRLCYSTLFVLVLQRFSLFNNLPLRDTTHFVPVIQQSSSSSNNDLRLR